LNDIFFTNDSYNRVFDRTRALVIQAINASLVQQVLLLAVVTSTQGLRKSARVYQDGLEVLVGAVCVLLVVRSTPMESAGEVLVFCLSGALSWRSIESVRPTW